jgi:predicted nucleotidyltransferase
MLNKDYKDILQILLDNNVQFLVVGAYALGAYGYPRATGDIDLWVMASPENSEKIYQSLIQFGAPMEQINEKTFSEQGVIFQIGVAPRRIDVITKIDGVDFQKAWTARQEIAIDGLKVPFISKQDLIKNKESTGREKDKLDAKELRKKK